MVFVQCLFGVAMAGTLFLYCWIGWQIGEHLGRFWDPGEGRYDRTAVRLARPLTPLAVLFYPTHLAYWLAIDSSRPFQHVVAPERSGGWDWDSDLPVDVRLCQYHRCEGHPYDLRIPSWLSGDYLEFRFAEHHLLLWGVYLAAALVRWPFVPLVYLWYVTRRRSILAAVRT